MGLFKNIAAGLRALTGRTRVERDMDEELDGFLTASTEAKLQAGLPPEAAARAARIEMGSTNAVKHRIRSAGWETNAENLWLDFRYSVRMLLKSPGFTLVAILSLALGIGANTAIFTLINSVILQQLPVRQPGQLVSFGKSLSGGLLGGVDLSFFDMYNSNFANQLEQNPGPFAAVFSYDSRLRRVGVQLGEHPTGPRVQIQSHMVSGSYFNALAVPMFLGRGLQPYDAIAPGRSAVVVVSYHYWRDTLEADRQALGKTITVNGVPCTIVGVAPPRFYGLLLGTEPPDLWIPVTMQADSCTNLLTWPQTGLTGCTWPRDSLRATRLRRLKAGSTARFRHTFLHTRAARFPPTAALKSPASTSHWSPQGQESPACARDFKAHCLS